MSNEIIKHDTELNTIPLRKFTPTEMNLFFSIVSRMRDKGSSIVKFSFDQLKDLSNYKATANNRFIDDIQKTYEKLMQLHFGRRSANGLNREFFVMFTRFKIVGDSANPYVEVQVHDMAIPLLNNLDSWVRYSLTEFRDLNSTYAKTMFRLLKQFRTIGKAQFSKADLNELLDVPKSYQQSDINKRVLKPIKEELSPLFSGLTIRKRRGSGRGNPVVGYVFTWKQETKDKDDFSQGHWADRAKKLQNIKHNGSMNLEEKQAATKRVLGRNEKISDLPDYLNPLHQDKKQLEEQQKKWRAERSAVAIEMSQLQVKERADKLTQREQNRLTKLAKRYAELRELTEPGNQNQEEPQHGK